MNSITKFAVKYPVSVLMLTLAVCLLGTISYNKLGTDLFPDLKNPSLYVEIKCGQRPPEEVEKLFASKAESQIARSEGVSSVYSVSETPKSPSNTPGTKTWMPPSWICNGTCLRCLKKTVSMS